MGCEISWAMEFQTVWAGTIDKRKPLHISWTALISKPNWFYLQQFLCQRFQKKKTSAIFGPFPLKTIDFSSSPFNIHTTRASGPAFLLGYSLTCAKAHRRCCRRPHSQSTSSEGGESTGGLEQFPWRSLILLLWFKPPDLMNFLTGNLHCDGGKLGQLVPILPHFLWRVKYFKWQNGQRPY